MKDFLKGDRKMSVAIMMRSLRLRKALPLCRLITRSTPLLVEKEENIE
jgi:hypothetical protein